jgi:hypothetical protein
MSKSILSAPHLKCLATAFEDLFDEFTYRFRIYRTSVFWRDFRVTTVAALAACLKTQDQFGIAEHRDVGIMAGEHELPPPLLLPHSWDDAFGDETVVEIVLWLIDDERGSGLVKEEQQDSGSLLAGGKSVQWLPLRWLSSTSVSPTSKTTAESMISSLQSVRSMSGLSVLCFGNFGAGARFSQRRATPQCQRL